MVDVSTLKKQIKGRVLLPGDEGFEESLNRWASNAERRAGIVVQVTSAADVSTTVNFANRLLLMIRLNSPGRIKFLSQLEEEVIQSLVHRLVTEAS